MVWEILLAVLLVIGVVTAINEARLKRAARKRQAGAAAGIMHPGTKAARKHLK